MMTFYAVPEFGFRDHRIKHEYKIKELVEIELRLEMGSDLFNHFNESRLIDNIRELIIADVEAFLAIKQIKGRIKENDEK